MVTIKMVSERCELSSAAVSKALNGQPGISPEKAEYVRKIAREMGYRPNAAARTLRMHRSYNIGVIFRSSLSHEFFSRVLDAVRAEAGRQGYDSTFLNDYVEASSTGYYEHAMQRQCDGVLVVHVSAGENDILRLVQSNIPVVSIEPVPEIRSVITNDNVGSMEEIVRYLAGLGHIRLALIHGEDGDSTRQRLAGFYRGCREQGIEVPEKYVIAAKYHEPEVSGEATRQILSYRERPTCILYPDDISCLGGMNEIKRQGLSVPDDISCFGYDGIYMVSVLRPPISTYRQNAQELGRQAVKELLSAIEDPRCFVPRVISVTGEIQPGGTVKDLRGN